MSSSSAENRKHQPNLILASSSKYREKLLNRLSIPFLKQSPDINEAPEDFETPMNTALRLARDKAKKIGLKYSSSFVIGCDQLVERSGKTLHKPMTKPRARRQLAWISGKTVSIFTGICLFNSGKKTFQSDVIKSSIEFRHLSKIEIENYLSLEMALDCAGGVKVEGLGITLMKTIAGDDPTAIEGLPLIRLSNMLRQEGLI